MTQAPMPGITIYDILRTLINRVGFPDETERRVFLDALDVYEKMGIFGNLAREMACTHPSVDRYGRCARCNKRV
jgi:hypothetical protein